MNYFILILIIFLTGCGNPQSNSADSLFDVAEEVTEDKPNGQESKEEESSSGEEVSSDDSESGNSDNDDDQDQTVGSENASRMDDRLLFQPFRYRQFFSYEEGVAIVSFDERKTIAFDSEKPIVFSKVFEEDLNRVKGKKITGSEQPWIKIYIPSEYHSEKQVFCYQFQPQNTRIEDSGLSEVKLKRDTLFRIAEKTNQACYKVKKKEREEFDKFDQEEEYVVERGNQIKIEVQNDMKAGSERVGTQVELDMIIDP